MAEENADPRFLSAVRDLQIRARVHELIAIAQAHATLVGSRPPEVRAELLENRIALRICELKALGAGSALIARHFT